MEGNRMKTNAEILTKIDCPAEYGEDAGIRVDVYNKLIDKVIRCKDCRFSDSTSIDSSLFCTNDNLDSSGGEYAVMIEVPPSHFCGYGEKND